MKYIYLFEAIGLERYKIGTSKDPSKRLLGLLSTQPCVDYKELLRVPSKDETTEYYEKSFLHSKYKNYNIKLNHSQEWFQFPPEILEKVIQDFNKLAKDYRCNPEVYDPRKDCQPYDLFRVFALSFNLRIPGYKPERIIPLNKIGFECFQKWLKQSLDLIGLAGQPRTAAGLNGYKGKGGYNLNKVLEGENDVQLTVNDFEVASYILLKIYGWNNCQPIFFRSPLDMFFVYYTGNWCDVVCDLAKCNLPVTKRTIAVPMTSDL